MLQHYDYIILGAGAAGLSLAYFMTQHQALANKNVLIIDKADKNQNDRTWTFWGDPPTDFRHLIRKTWRQVGLYDHTNTVEASLDGLPYHYIPGDVFYGFTFEAIQKAPHFHFLKATVQEVRENENTTTVVADDQHFTAGYVFNSAYPGTTNIKSIQDCIAYQRFKGWEVQFEEAVIDPEKVTLMDFTAGPDDSLQFAYLLPLASNRLIINYTAFGRQVLPQHVYDERMADYLHTKVSPKPYRIVRHERGIIPMSHLPFQRYYGNHVINLGILGGDTRASTGYTFMQAVTNARSLAAQLAKGQKPQALEHHPRQTFYDRIFLHVLAVNPQALEHGLVQLFKRNPSSRVFRFLSGQTAFVEELPLVFSLPISPFLRGFWQMLTKNKVCYARQYSLSEAGH